MRTDAAACPARRGQAQGLRPWEPRQRRCLYTPQGTSRAGRGEPPLDPAARFLRRLAAEENAWRDSEGWGGFSVAQRKVFFHFISERTPCAPPPHQSKVLGRWEVGVRGGGRKPLLQKVFPPSSPGMSRLPTLHPATALPRKGSKTRSPRSPRNGWAALRQPQAADRTTPCPFPRCPRRQQRPRR